MYYKLTEEQYQSIPKQHRNTTAFGENLNGYWIIPFEPIQKEQYRWLKTILDSMDIEVTDEEDI